MRILLFVLVLSLMTGCLVRNTVDKSKIPKQQSLLSLNEVEDYKFESSHTSYIPIYSDLVLSDENLHIALQSFVSIRNLSFETPFRIDALEYYDTNGKFIKNYIDQPIFVNKLATYEVVVPTNDLDGGAGAKIIIKYSLISKIDQHPLIEALFTGMHGTKAVSFSSRSVLLK